MTERFGRLKRRTHVFTWKWVDNIPGNDRHYYSDAGSTVWWDGEHTNEGHEDSYGGRRLLWTEVWNDELGRYASKGLEESEVEWDD